MYQKKYLLLLAFVCFILSCGKMYDNIEQYTGEVVYPGRYDTIVGHIGFERVEIDLMKAGRIPSKNIKLGKAIKTVIEYDNKEVVIDSLVSWVNITGLTLSKLYRFSVYTIDDLGNKSVPQEIALIPYTSSDLSSLVVQPPQALASQSSAILTWPAGLSSILLDYYGLQYGYTDKSSVRREGAGAANPRIFAYNLQSGSTVNFDLKYKIIPKVNGTPILDTVELSQTLPIAVPLGSSTFAPAEKALLQANNITTFTVGSVATVEKLTLPVHTTTFQDLFYCTSLKELDLTGGTIFEMAKTNYNANGITDTIGGGSLVPFARRAGDMPNNSAQYLIDLLESGTLTKIKYIPNSMGIDNLLAPYISSGKVELVDNKPDEAFVDFRFLLDGLAQTSAWAMDLEAPAATPPAGTGLQNIIKAVVKVKNSSFALSLPKEYEFDVQHYKYLKFKVYAPKKEDVSGIYDVYKRLWPRIMNYMWAYSQESTFGQQYWDNGKDSYTISDANLESWIDMTIDLSKAVDRHNRVVVINIGGEPSLTYESSKRIPYYFANFRFTKN